MTSFAREREREPFHNINNKVACAFDFGYGPTAPHAMTLNRVRAVCVVQMRVELRKQNKTKKTIA